MGWRKRAKLGSVVVFGLVAMSCGKSDSGDSDAGHGGSDTAGTTGKAGATGEGGAIGMRCTGPSPSRGGGSASPLSERVECYVSEHFTDNPECLAPEAADLVARLQDKITGGYGFVVTTVIESSPTMPLPASCEALAQCCEQQPEYDQRFCYDYLERPNAGRDIDGCPVFSEDLREHFQCPAGGGGSVGNEGGASGSGGASGAAGESGGSPPSTRALCCYQTCGYTQYQ